MSHIVGLMNSIVEDMWCTVKICVHLQVGQICFDALLVLPEGVAFWEFAIMSVHAMLECLAT